MTPLQMVTQFAGEWHSPAVQAHLSSAMATAVAAQAEEMRRGLRDHGVEISAQVIVALHAGAGMEAALGPLGQARCLSGGDVTVSTPAALLVARLAADLLDGVS